MPATHRDVMVLDISKHGFFVDLGNEKLYVTYEDFPWFAGADIEQLSSVELAGNEHVYWPALNISVPIVSLRDPVAFPPVAAPRTPA